MKYSILKKIRETVNFFDDTEFDSLLGENTVLVRNLVTGNIYSIPFKIQNKEEIIFEAQKAKMLERAEQYLEEDYIESLENTIQEKYYNIEQALKDFFENDNISFLKKTIISNIDYIELKKEKEMAEYNETKELIDDIDTERNEKFDSLTESEKEQVRKIKELFARQIKEYEYLKKTFFENGKIFKKSGKIKRENLFDPLKLVNLYSEKKEIREEFLSQYSILNHFYEKVSSELGLNKKDENAIFKDINIFNESDFKVNLAKNLVLFKKNNPEQNIKILSKKINGIYNEVFKDFKPKFEFDKLDRFENKIFSLSTDSNSKIPKFKFLKFRIGLYSPSDLVELRNEFDEIIKKCYSFNQEDLMFIQRMRDQIDFMIKIGKIDDELVSEIINTFNSTFGEKEEPKAIQNQENYNDEDYDNEDVDEDEDEDLEEEDYDYDDEDEDENEDEDEDYDYNYNNTDHKGSEYENKNYNSNDEEEERRLDLINLREAIRRAKEKVRSL